MRKSMMRIFSFLLILILILCYTDSVFALKRGDGIYGVTKLYELENGSIDVLVLGSSHAFENVNTGVLWEEHGIASYVLAGSYQQLWYTYYYLKEALKTQKPQLIILEAYMTMFKGDYYPQGTVVNTYGLKWSKDKLDAIKVSTPEDKWGEYIFGYIQYHTRYTDLSETDFLKNQGNPLYENWKGFLCNMQTTSFDNPDIRKVSRRESLSEKTEMYYRKIIELSVDNDIPLLIVVSPYAGITENVQAVFNTASDIAAEYDVPFINYNLLYNEMGIDFSSDAADEEHLNYRGNQKYTHALGEYIVDNYNIPDRRGDDKYESWEAHSQYISSSIKNQKLSEALESGDIHEIVSNMMDQEYMLFVSGEGDCNNLDPEMTMLFDTLGIPDDQENGVWYLNNQKGILYASGEGEYHKDFRLDYHDVYITRSLEENTQKHENSVIIDNVSYKKVEDGVNITVYNPVTQSIIDSFGFDREGNLVR